MRIAYVTTYRPQQVRSWGGGTAYFMAEEFQAQGADIDYISPLIENRRLSGLRSPFYRRILKRDYLVSRNRRVAEDLARQAAHQLNKTFADIVLAPIPTPICYLDCPQPIVLWADATFAGLLNFYPEFSNLSQESRRDGQQSEQAALDRCSLAIFSSDWAAQTALEHYHLPASKVKVVPYGANLANCDRQEEQVKSMIQARASNHCKLLLLGVDWLRKGGRMALEVTQKLNHAGLNTTLTVVGCEPLEASIPDSLRSLGFIDKSTAAGAQQINELLAESHFLILPSRSDCTPMVFSEANSFGVPCLTTQVGGISTIVKDGLNGKTFPLEANPADYCDYVLDLFADFSKYQALALSSFHEYEARLNWSVTVKTVKQMMLELIS